MKSLQKIKKVLSDVEITEEQQAALDEFFAELHESLEDKIRGEYQEEIELLQESLSENNYSSKDGWVRVEDAERAFELAMNDAESAFELAMEDAERAFELGMNDAESAFELAMEDAERAFDLVQKDLVQEHSKVMTEAMEELYDDLLEKAKEQLYESSEFENVQKIKAILAPSILEESNSQTLLTKVQKLQAQLEEVKKDKERVEVQNIVESLVEELPVREAKVVRKYISEAHSVDEVYERYNLAISLLEAKEEDTEKVQESVKPSFSKSNRSVINESYEDEEDEDEDEELLRALEEDEDYEDDEDDEELVESFFKSRSNEKLQSNKMQTIEEQIISSVFKK